MHDLRCSSKKHGIIIPEKRLIEIKCSSRFCGARRGTIILHRFSTETGELVETLIRKDPSMKGHRE